MNSKSKHIQLYSDVGPLTSAIGWVLQQSPSIDLKWFRKNTTSPQQYNKDVFSDPWDSRIAVHQKSAIKQKYCEIVEISENPWTMGDLDDWVAESLPLRAVFGLNHGAWRKTAYWNNPHVQNVYFETTDIVVDAFFNMYCQRPYRNIKQVVDSIEDHVFDHKNSNQIYKQKLYELILPKAEQIFANGEIVRFWQLQHTYHLDSNYFPMPDEQQKIQKKYRDEYKEVPTVNQNFVVFTNPHIVYDPLNMDLKNVCNILDIVYSERMEREYQQVREFYFNAAQV
jgi:hypothetical protein